MIKMQSVAIAKKMKNDKWITNGEAPDPEVLPKVPGFHLLVRPVSVKQETKGGILLPDSTKNDIAYLTTVGKVLKVGDIAYKDDDKFPNGPWCQEGDWVIFSRYAGSRSQIKDGECRILNDEEILATIDKPEDILTP